MGSVNRDLNYDNSNGWREGNSRKGIPNKEHPKRDLIRAYAAGHPDATQREIAAALGVSKTTVNKWLKPDANPRPAAG